MLKDKQFCKVTTFAELPAEWNENTLYLVTTWEVLYERNWTAYVLIISPGMIDAAIAAHVALYH